MVRRVYGLPQELRHEASLSGGFYFGCSITFIFSVANRPLGGLKIEKRGRFQTCCKPSAIS